jgi:hypothetical protein
MVVCIPIQTFIRGVIKMSISITDEIISQFLSGVLTICAIIIVGGTLALLLRGMNRNFNFTRLSLILGLAPLSLVSFMDPKTSSTLYLFSMIVVLLGITVDGINYLLLPKERQRPAEKVEEQAPAAAEPDSGVIIWEKAE